MGQNEGVNMEFTINVEHVKQIMELAGLMTGYGFGIAPVLQLFAYGIFKAISLVNINNIK